MTDEGAVAEPEPTDGRARWAPWLTWLPPVIVAIVLLVALRPGGSTSDQTTAGPTAGTPAAGTETTETPAGTETTAGGSAEPSTAGSTPPTTAFAERVPTLPDQPFDYRTELPDHFLDNAIPGAEQRAVVDLDNTPSDNPITDDGATLGRVLFYDVNLSSNHTVRCASCHVQANGFTDPLTFSQGVGGQRTRRNSMPLANAAFNLGGHFFWDERADFLETQVLIPFEDATEMNLPVAVVVERIEARSYYEPLFTAAFGDAEVTTSRISAALSQFIRAMVSADSRYDQGRAEVASPLASFPLFTDEENRGKELFYMSVADGGGSCSSCHTSEAQVNTPLGLENNGIDPPVRERVAADLGAFEITGDREQIGSFRVPSLRNIEVTAPYMHDGRFTSLEQVVDHYNEGIEPHDNLGEALRDADGNPVRMGLSADDKRALVAFLATLTDRAFLTDERFSEPFRPS